jgi:hypothetical protein
MPETTVTTPAVAGTAPAGAGKAPAAKSPETAAKPATGGQAVKGGEKAPNVATGRAARLAAIEAGTAGVKPASAAKPAEAPATGGTETEADTEAVTDGGKPARKAPAPTGYTATRIAELEAENATLKMSSRDALIAELKESPGKIFKLIGDPDLLTKLAEAKAKGEDPKDVIEEAIRNAVKPLEEKLSAKDAAEKTANEQRLAAEVLGATRQLFADGYKEGEEMIADPSKWKLATKLTKAAVIDAPAEAYASMRKMVAGIQGKLKAAGKPARQFTNKEAAVMLAVSFDAIEKREAARALHYRDETETPKPGEGKGEKIVRRSISSKIGYGQAVNRGEANTPEPRNKFERRQQRLARIQN